jgi:uncharacterized protein YfaS (alpha-2-macroglobulin family)
MASFQRDETVVIKGTIKDENLVLTTPATSTLITITDPAGTEVTADQAVTFDSVGTFRYLYVPSATAVLGAYHVRVKATHNASRISITDSQFFLVD